MPVNGLYFHEKLALQRRDFIKNYALSDQSQKTVNLGLNGFSCCPSDEQSMFSLIQLMENASFRPEFS
jgi:hypothetical protein